MLNYPLTLSFRIIALGTQVAITDASGGLVAYVRQKALKLKEDITVFAEQEQTRALFSIKADRVIDFSANYHFATPQGHPVGSIKRQGMRSMWKAHYDISDPNGQVQMTLREENPWIKVAEAVVSEIPLVGIFAGYFLHPSYLITHANGTPVMRLKKVPSLVERRFSIDKLAELHPHDEARAVLGCLMMVLLERARG